MTYALLLAGVAALYFGAEWLVRGAARIAAALDVSPLVIGLTVVAFGTSMPEMVAGAAAAWNGRTDIVLGNVLGSNIANVGLILGLAALLRPVPVSSSLVRREVPVMLIVTLLVIGVAATGTIGRGHGVILFAMLVVFAWAALRWARVADEPAQVVGEMARFGHELGLDRRTSVAIEAGRVLVGLAVLVGGAQLLVQSASDLARQFGVSELIISISVVAIGTSLPELATSIVAVLRDEADVLVGNIVGSNIFNLLGALGVAAVIRPLPVAAEVLRVDFPAAAGFSVLMAVALRSDRTISRTEGAVALVAYLVFIVWRVT